MQIVNFHKSYYWFKFDSLYIEKVKGKFSKQSLLRENIYI